MFGNTMKTVFITLVLQLGLEKWNEYRCTYVQALLTQFLTVISKCKRYCSR